MKKFRNTRPGSSRRLMASWAGLFLLMVYVAGAIAAEVVHQAMHDHGAAGLHTRAVEKDPCHRAIYHQATAQGCHHKAHFTPTHKCACIHVIYLPAQVADRLAGTTLPFRNERLPSTVISIFVQGCITAHTLRGPPAFVS